MKEQYTYAVARIRVKETELLKKQDIENLISSKGYEECLRFLGDKGWDVSEKTSDFNKVLALQTRKLWEFADEIIKDKSALNILRYTVDFNNLKAAIKLCITNGKSYDILMDTGTISKEEMWACVSEQKFEDLPEALRSTAKEAFDTLLHTKDSQKSDAIIDRGLLYAIKSEGEKSDVELIKQYAQRVVAYADIKIALRGCKMKKSIDFLRKSMVECKALDIEKLAKATTVGTDEICEYLFSTGYADAVENIKVSFSEFEKWADDSIIDMLKKEKNNYFTLGPVIAYILGKESEIKAVRTILSAKIVNLDEQLIRKRMRNLYA